LHRREGGRLFINSHETLNSGVFLEGFVPNNIVYIRSIQDSFKPGLIIFFIGMRIASQVTKSFWIHHDEIIENLEVMITAQHFQVTVSSFENTLRGMVTWSKDIS
jgi:hypothetical protein